MRIIFCGTPDFGLPTLRLLLSEPDFTLDAVVTQPDRPRGRGQAVSSSAIKDAAVHAGVFVFQPEKIRADSARDFFEQQTPDAVVIIAYGQIIPGSLIEIPRLGWINLHASLLPKYRGAAPISWAILNGESMTGLTSMQIDAGMDTGPILLQHKIDIGPDEAAPSLARRMAELGAPLVVDSLRKLERGELQPTPQDPAQATYAPKLKKEHGRIYWQQPAQQIYNRIRGLIPWPGAYTVFREHLCHVWGRPAESAIAGSAERPGTLVVGGGAAYVVCGHGSCLNLEAVQMEGRKRITAREFTNGARLAPGERFQS